MVFPQTILTDLGEVTNNVINSNINPTHRQKKVKNYKGDSKTNSRSSYNNKDIKYQHSNKKSRKKVKPTVQNKRNSSNGDSTDKGDNDRIPGLQDCNQSDGSSKDDDEYNRSESEDYPATENDDKYDRLPYNITSTNSIITSEWINNDTDDNNYDGDNDEDETSRISTKLLSSMSSSLPSPGDLPNSMTGATTSPIAVPSAMLSPVSNNTGKPSPVPRSIPSPGDSPRYVIICIIYLILI